MQGFASVAARCRCLTTYRAHGNRLFIARQQRNQARPWVPPAYRGALPPLRRKGAVRSNGLRPSAGKVESTRVVRVPYFRETVDYEEEQKRYEEEQKIYEEEQKRKAMIARKEEKIFGLHDDIVRLGSEYKAAFTSDPFPVEPIEVGFNAIYGNRGLDGRKAALQSMVERMKVGFNDVYQADTPVEWYQIENSEEQFRGLCRMLQDTILISTELYLGGYRIPEFVDLAENSLRVLVRLGSERALLLESTKKLGSKALGGNVQSPTLSEEESSRRPSGFKSWINNILEGFANSGSKASPPPPKATFAHEDAAVQASQKLFLHVMKSIAATAQISLTDDIIEDSTERSPREPTDRKAMQEAAPRMVALLELAPTEWLPDAELLKLVFQMLCGAGTLESARTCLSIFNKSPNNRYRIRFSLVLQAYLEAILGADDRDQQRLIAQEAVNALNAQWTLKMPGHRADRILHCKIVLACMAKAKAGAEPRICEVADRLIKRTLGEEGYFRTIEGITAEKPSFDMKILPLLNYRAQIYASSQDRANVESAKLIARYMMKIDREKVDQCGMTLETMNTIIEALVSRYEGVAKNKINKAEALEDVCFTRDLIAFVIEWEESGCNPNETSFILAFRLLQSVKPEDIGEAAEELLSHVEVRHALSSPSNPFNISLSIYHRCLKCWLIAAESTSDVLDDPSRPSERALHLLDKLEMQSIPLLLDDRGIMESRIKGLYDPQLRPTVVTYNIVLSICARLRTGRAFLIGSEICRRMVARGIKGDPEPFLNSFASSPEHQGEVAQLKALIQLAAIPAGQVAQPAQQVA